MGRTPLSPRLSASQYGPTPSPSGLTMPMPVSTTRRDIEGYGAGCAPPQDSNPKFEYRNPKQIQNPKFETARKRETHKPYCVSDIRVSYLFRISIFGFRILCRPGLFYHGRWSNHEPSVRCVIALASPSMSFSSPLKTKLWSLKTCWE